jgi:hypothetical protein
MLNDKGFNGALVAIKKSSDGLAQLIHDAGIFAIAQVNEHGNDGFAVRLVEAMGKKHDAQRVVNWLVRFGKLGVKKGAIVYRNRKDITPETLPVWIERAEATPYWDLTPQKQLVEHVDYLGMVASIINKHKAVIKKQEEGKEVEEKNVSILPELEALYAKLTAKAAPIEAQTNAVVSM